jgi:para-nitrobenzyl esterase
MLKNLLIVVVVLIAVAVYLQPGQRPELVAPGASDEALRTTTAGPVVGFEDAHNTLAWLGIPFARPPVGVLRWRAPHPAEPWQENRLATSFNNACVQLWGPLAGEPGEAGDVVGNEDCLYLNIWSPQAHSNAASGDPARRALPVMVWIHGGGNTIGTANTYNSAVLAGGENVIVVTINYRLGYFGWMSHPALRGESVSARDGSGNYGILDMIAALEWVQNNIASFGGNPDNVTIFGESAGGRNVYSLMASPLASGLFHRAIAQSGSTRSTPLWRAENFTDDQQPGMASSSREWLARQLQASGRAEGRNAARAAQLLLSNKETAEFMRSRSAGEVLSGVTGMAGMYSAPQSLRDGTVLPTESQLTQLQSSESYNAVPLMTGTNKDEAKLFMAQSPTYVNQFLGFLPRIKDIDAYNRAAAYASDQWKASSVDEVATVVSQTPAQPVYAYRWDWDEGAKTWIVDYGELIGAGHGMEVSYVFGSFEGGLLLPGFYNEENTPGRDELSRQMRSYWSEFARTGSPGRGREGDLPQWQAWHNGQENLMLLDSAAGGGLRMVHEPMTVAMIKQRIVDDSELDSQQRCAMFAEMFFKSNAGDDFWDEAEYQQLGCGDLDPWQAELPR